MTNNISASILFFVQYRPSVIQLFIASWPKQASRMFLAKNEAIMFLPGSRRGFHSFLNSGRSKVSERCPSALRFEVRLKRRGQLLRFIVLICGPEYPRLPILAYTKHPSVPMSAHLFRTARGVHRTLFACATWVRWDVYNLTDHTRCSRLKLL